MNYKMKFGILVALVSFGLPVLADQGLVCNRGELVAKIDDQAQTVTITILSPYGAEDIFAKVQTANRGIQTPEEVTVVFAKSDCSGINQNLLVCSGRPLRAALIPYWHSSSKVNEREVKLAYLHLQIAEITFTNRDNIIGKSTQVHLSGGIQGRAGSEAVIDIPQGCKSL